MSEISKLYENAGIKKEIIKGCYDYYSKLGIDIWKENDCAGKNCDTCKKDKSIKEYPPFTAEKQIELIKWLSKRPLALLIGQYKGKYYFGNNNYNSKADNFDNAIAIRINDLWQSLTSEERQQVKGILE